MELTIFFLEKILKSLFSSKKAPKAGAQAGGAQAGGRPAATAAKN